MFLSDNKRLPGGKLLNKRHKVFANGSIVIENVQKKTDQGTYYCEASNDKHVVRASVEVIVIGKNLYNKSKTETRNNYYN